MELKPYANTPKPTTSDSALSAKVSVTKRRGVTTSPASVEGSGAGPVWLFTQELSAVNVEPDTDLTKSMAHLPKDLRQVTLPELQSLSIPCT